MKTPALSSLIVLATVIFLVACGTVSNKSTVSAAPPPDQGTLLTSRAGTKFVGDQLEAFTVSGDTITAKKPSFIILYYTEEKPFRLTGEVWLGGPSDAVPYSADLPDGFTIWLREWGSLNRYSMNSRSVAIKRRSHDGINEKNIVPVASFPQAELGGWVPFSVEATAKQIAFKFDA